VEHWEQDYVTSLLGEAEEARALGRFDLAGALTAHALVVALRDQGVAALSARAHALSVAFGHSGVVA
jgi:hypothetical protein